MSEPQEGKTEAEEQESADSDAREAPTDESSTEATGDDTVKVTTAKAESETGGSADETKPDGLRPQPDESAEESSSEEEAEDGSTEVDTAPTEETKLDSSSGEQTGTEGSGIRFRYYGQTEVGLVREHNEDNFVIVDLAGNAPKMIGAERDSDESESDSSEETKETQPPRGVAEGSVVNGLVLAVCDGMGGAAAGEVASAMAVETIAELMSVGKPPSDRDAFAHRLVYAIEEAGSRIFAAAKMDRSRRGMGTTATVAGLVDNILFIGQVGDSRCYVLRNGELGLVTKDQSLVNQLIEAGQLTEEEAEAFEHSNIILQALGTTEEVTVDLTFFEVRKGDRILLCSDGLSGLVHGEMIKEVMAEDAELPDICTRLIEMANAGGGHDNITCVLCDFGGDALQSGEGAACPMYSQYPLPPAEQYAEELPVRESSMKAGTRKPGSDVKRDAVQYDAADPDVPQSSFPWWLVAAIFLVIAVVAVVFGMSRRDQGTPEPPRSTEPTEPPAPPATPEEVEVRVQTDIDGELFVDGRFRQELRAGEQIRLELVPGAYRLEAKVGGSAVASETITVQEGSPLDVALNMPSGAMGLEDVEAIDDEGGDEDEPTEEEGADEPPREPAPMTAAPMTAAMAAPMTAAPMTAVMAAAPMVEMRPVMSPAPMMSATEDTPENPF